MLHEIFIESSKNVNSKNKLAPLIRYKVDYEDTTYTWSHTDDKNKLKVFCFQWNMAGKVRLSEWTQEHIRFLVHQHQRQSQELFVTRHHFCGQSGMWVVDHVNLLLWCQQKVE